MWTPTCIVHYMYSVAIYISNKGDIIVQIDRQELSHMTLAQATLALGTSSPLLRLAVYRPAVEDGTNCRGHFLKIRMSFSPSPSLSLYISPSSLQ